MVTRTTRTPRLYTNNNNTMYNNTMYNNIPASKSKASTNRLRRRVSKVIREAKRRNDDPTNNRYTFDRTNKRVLAKQLNTVLRDLNEEVRALKKSRKPTSRRSKLTYAAGALAVAGGAYLSYTHATMLLSAASKLAEVAKGVYPASSKVFTVLKTVPSTVAAYTKSAVVKTKANKVLKFIRNVATSRVTSAAATGMSLYSTYVPNSVKSGIRTGAKAAKNYAAPYLAKLRRSKNTVVPPMGMVGYPKSRLGNYF